MQGTQSAKKNESNVYLVPSLRLCNIPSRSLASMAGADAANGTFRRYFDEVAERALSDPLGLIENIAMDPWVSNVFWNDCPDMVAAMN